MVVILAGICGILSRNRSIVGCGMIMGTLAIFLSLTAVLVDGFSYIAAKNLETCVDTSTGLIYGNTQYTTEARLCAVDEDDHSCACVNGDYNECFPYTMKDGDDCNDPIYTYPSLLLWCTIACCFSFALSVVYTIFTCASNWSE